MTTPSKRPTGYGYRTRRGLDAIYQANRAYQRASRRRRPIIIERRKRKEG